MKVENDVCYTTYSRGEVIIMALSVNNYQAPAWNDIEQPSKYNYHNKNRTLQDNMQSAHQATGQC